MTNESARKSVIQFYVQMNEEINNYGVLGFMEVLMKMVFYPNFYIHVDTDYYEVKLWFPYAGTFYENVPIPGH